MARIITITSGKGGVGKTSISLNLSLSLASKGYRVCLFDADLGLANVNILTGIYPEKNLINVIDNQAGLDEILIKDFQGIDIIPGSSGVEQLADLTPDQTRRLIKAFLDLDDYDYFIFDTSAGISSQVLAFCMASHELILVATSEPTSMTDAYSMLKTLSKFGYTNPVKILVNQVKTGKAAKLTYSQLKETVNRFLNIKVEPLGIVGWDKSVRMAVVSQTPFLLLFPDSLASKCVRTITEKIIDKEQYAADTPLELFWDRCLTFFEQNPLKENTRRKPRVSKKPVSNNEDRKKLPENETPADSTEKPDLVSEDQTLKIQKAITSIDLKLTDLLKEVAQVRQLIEKNENQNNINAKAPAPKRPLPEPKKITLDFESWLNDNKQQFSRR